MKHSLIHILYIFFSFVLLLFAGSCINDDLDTCVGNTGKDTDPVNTVGYMSMRLQTADGLTRTTRVGDSFDYGEKEEFVLAAGQHHFAIFYNDDQTAPLAVATLSGFSEGEEGNKQSSSTVVLATIATKSEYLDILKQLQECFVILNTDIPIDRLWTISKEDLLGTIVSSPFYTTSGGKSYFTMCNAVSIKDGAKIIASKVDTNKIYTSYMEAIERAWKGEAAVEAYVERLAAKFSLSFNHLDYNNPAIEKIFSPSDKLIFFSELNNGIPYYEEREYRIKITGWGMNALEKESYLFRNVKVGGNYFDGWYNPTNSRLFWSEDCNYGQAVYPWQYRKAIDNPGIPYYAGQNNILQNLSFEELHNPFERSFIYTPENTYDFDNDAFNRSLDSRVTLLAGTHLIVCAELLTDLDVRGTFTATDLYRDRNGNFYRSEKECFEALVASFNNSLESHSFLKFIDYDWTRGGGQQQLFADTRGRYSLYYNGNKLTPEYIEQLEDRLTADATIQGGDGQRLIWMDGMSIRDEDGKPLQIYSNIDEVDPTKNKFLHDATVDDIKSLLFEHIGAVDHFNGGKMYYAVPVGYIKDESNPDEYSVYGVVRNNVYTVVIDDVTGLGTSIDKVDEPIVPNKVTTYDHLFISFDILDWHLTEQNVPGVIN